MKIEATTFALRNALSVVAKVQPRGAHLDVPGMTLVTSDDNGVWLTGTALDVWARHRVEGATADAHGELLLSTGHLQKLLGNTQHGGVVIHADPKNPGVTAIAGAARMQIPGRAADDFPRMPELGEAEAEATFSGVLLREAIRSVAWACSRELGRPLLRCVHLTVRDGSTVIEATSGIEFAVLRAPWLAWKEEASVMVRAEYARMLGAFASEDRVDLSCGGGWLLCATTDNRAEFWCKTESGAFPSLDRVLRASPPISSLEADAAPLIAAADMASVTTKENHACRFQWQDGVLVMTAESTDAGQTTTTIPAVPLEGGKSLKVAMSGNRMIAALKALGADRVNWGSSGTNRPQHFRNAAPEDDAPDLLVGVMPLNWEKDHA